MSTLTDFVTGVDERIQDEESKLSQTIREECVAQALAEYNRVRPRYLVEESAGDNTSFLAVPASWDSEFSKIARLDKLNSDDEPTLIHPSRYQVIQNPAPEDPVIFWSFDTFALTTTYRVKYTVPHTVTALASSVPSGDEAALMDLAACHACLRLAAAYAQMIDQSIGTEVINFKNKSGYYRSLSKDLRARYNQTVKGSGASGQKAWVREQTLLFHG